MKRSFKSMLGVTLLEIMLVLAIAALIIVMSIRYFQSASTNEKVNAAVDTVTGIVAAGENYNNANGSFSGITASSLNSYLPGGKPPASPWGGSITIMSVNATIYKISMPVPATGNDCTLLVELLKSNNKLKPAACSGTILWMDITE